MKQKLARLCATAAGSFTGVFLGTSIWRVWEYTSNPQRFAVQSAPWYTSILMLGGFTAVLVAVLLVTRHLLLRPDRRQRR